MFDPILICCKEFLEIQEFTHVFKKRDTIDYLRSLYEMALQSDSMVSYTLSQRRDFDYQFQQVCKLFNCVYSSIEKVEKDEPLFGVCKVVDISIHNTTRTVTRLRPLD